MRQLSLFKGKRQRGVQPPPAPEFNSHVFIADLLRRWGSPRWRWTHIPSGEHREHRYNSKGQRFSPTGNRLKRMGLVAGFPDFLFFGPERAVRWLELKRKKLGRVSEDQEDIFGQLEACGFRLGEEFLITDDVKEATEWLKAHGILRATIEVQ
jgi:hypothetical protein